MSVPDDCVIALVQVARSRVLPGPEENIGVPIDTRMQGVLDLVNAGDAGVAFEVLSDSLLDYDIRLTEEDLTEVASVAATLGVDHERYVAQLRDLVVAHDRIVETRTLD
jgi:hypothetical protein